MFLEFLFFCKFLIFNVTLIGGSKMRSVMKNVMRSVVIVVSLLLFFTAQAGAGLVYSDAPHVFTEYFNGAPVSYTEGNADLDQGVTGTSGQWTYWNSDFSAKREADASGYVRLAGKVGVGEFGINTKNKFSVASTGTEFYWGGYNSSDYWGWGPGRMGIWTSANFMQVIFNQAERRFKLEYMYNGVEGSTNEVYYTGLNQSWHDFSLVLDATTVTAYVDGIAVDLNGAAAGEAVTHGFSAATLSGGFAPALNGISYNSTGWVRLNSMEVVNVPEPATIALISMGLLGVLRRKKR